MRDDAEAHADSIGDGAAVVDAWRGSRWRVDWYEQQPDGSKKLRAKMFRTKPLAAEFLAKVEHDIRSGTYRPLHEGKRTLGAVVKLWMESKRSTKGATRHAYEQDIRVWIDPRWKGVAIGSITRQDIETWVSALYAGTAPRAYRIEFKGDRAGLGASRVRRLYSIVSAALSYAATHEWIPTNVAQGIELDSRERAEQVFLSIPELEALAEGAQRGVDRVLILFLGYVGVRIGEAAALRVADVDLTTRRARIRSTVTLDAKGRGTVGAPKTGQARTVPIPKFLTSELRPLLKGREDDDWVFRSKRGARIDVHNWRRRAWADALERAGAGKNSALGELGLTPHKLRHTAASLAIASGADVKVVQTMLGHADASETLNTYGHLFPDRLDEVTDRLEKARRKALKPKKKGKQKPKHHD
ncbi:tyrosine-type recombinase/integrase [Microbacterium sp.]|uniref:tyrosine-type recombinase/integrase n=1 Tax=Microbacterium sp. TaxID=51671 RepID=UPI003C74BA95